MNRKQLVGRLKRRMAQTSKYLAVEPVETPVRPNPPPLRNRAPLPIVAADGRDTVGEDSQAPELTRSALLERLAECRTPADVEQLQRWIGFAVEDSQIGLDDLQELTRAIRDRLTDLRRA